MLMALISAIAAIGAAAFAIRAAYLCEKLRTSFKREYGEDGWGGL